MVDVSNLIKQMTLEEKISLLCGSVKESMHTEGCERLGVSEQILCDGPLGVRMEGQPEQDCTCFPCGSAIAATWNKELIEKMGEGIGEDCIHHGMDMILGPGANIKRTPLCGRNFEYFSEDPILSGKIAAAYIRGVESKGIGTSVKHYACNNQEIDRQSVSVNIDERTLREIYLRSFEIAIKEGKPSSVMTAHNRINGLKCAENTYLLKQVLRDEWGYEGILLTDWGDTKHAVSSIRAGVDLAMPYRALQRPEVLEGLENGKLTEEDIDNAIYRLVAFAKRQKKASIEYSKQKLHGIAHEVAAEGTVLLKNDDDILPITSKKYKKIAVIGEFAEKPVYYGQGSARVFPANESVISPLQALKEKFGDEVEIDYIRGYSSDPTGISVYAWHPNMGNDIGRRISQADIVLMFVGNYFGDDTEECDKTSAMLNTKFNAYITRVGACNKNLVVVLQNGSAIVPHTWNDRTKGIVEMWIAGEAGGNAIVDVLCGDVTPCGKLPETFPSIERKDLEYPGDAYRVNYDEKWAIGYRYYDMHHEQIAYPFGFGMSYTTFEYSNLEIKDNGKNIDVSFDIKNSGSYVGKEIAQIYVSKEISFVSRPEKELKEFYKTKVLQPGESENVTITIEKKNLAYFSINDHKEVVEPGIYKISIGASSRDIRLIGEYTHPNEDNIFMFVSGFGILG